jgi:phage recombination protein Bet
MTNQIELSNEQLKTLETANVIPKGTPSAQVAVFAQVCREKGLSPFSKEIYLTAYRMKDGSTIYSNIVGVDGFRSMLQRTGEYMGNSETKFNVKGDGSYLTAFEVMEKVQGLIGTEYTKNGVKEKSTTIFQVLLHLFPITATFEVFRSVGGVKCSFSKTVIFSEFAGVQKWTTMPIQMIEKVAKCFAYKEALGAAGSGLNIEEEKAAFEDTQAAIIQIEEIEPQEEQKPSFTAAELAEMGAMFRKACKISRQDGIDCINTIEEMYKEKGVDFTEDCKKLEAHISKLYPHANIS